MQTIKSVCMLGNALLFMRLCARFHPISEMEGKEKVTRPIATSCILQNLIIVLVSLRDRRKQRRLEMFRVLFHSLILDVDHQIPFLDLI